MATYEQVIEGLEIFARHVERGKLATFPGAGLAYGDEWLILGPPDHVWIAPENEKRLQNLGWEKLRGRWVLYV